MNFVPMNILHRLTIVLLFALPLTLRAYDIVGRVASATDDQPLPGATLRLLALPDSTQIAAMAADAEGNFKLSTSKVRRKGAYVILFSYVGFKPVVRAFTARDMTHALDLHDVYLAEDTKLLDETVVSAVPPPMVVREDTVEYYAAGYKTQAGASVEGLLQQLPGVEVGDDGSITAQGKKVEQVYVDGKEFFGNNTQLATKNLSADMVESVQVVDLQNDESRRTGIDDGERRKVINLKLKPKMRRGKFGNVSAALGGGNDIDTRYETQGLAGYFRGDLQSALLLGANNTNNTGFGDLGDGLMSGSQMRGDISSGARGNGINESWQAGINVNYDEGNRLRDINSPLAASVDAFGGGSRQNEESTTHKLNYLKSGNTESDSHTTGFNRSRNFGLDPTYERTFGEDGRHHISIRPSFSYNDTYTREGNDGATHYADSLAMGNDGPEARYISQTTRTSTQDQTGYQYGLNLSYTRQVKLERGRRRSSVSLSFSHNRNEGNQYIDSYTSYDSLLVSDIRSHADTTLQQWREEDSRRDNYRLRLTHVEPLAQRHFLELSASTSYSRRSQRQVYHFWDEATQTYADSINGRSSADYNALTYTTQINNSFGLSYRTVQEHYNLNFGLEVQPQSQEYEDRWDHSRDYKRHYINYSPRLEYRYRWSKDMNLRISYRGQTSQPSMNQLQAVKNQTSATHVRLGNPDLSPSYSNTLEMRWVNYLRDSQQSYEASITGRSSFNGMTSRRWYSDDLRTDTTQTVNLSGLGDWSLRSELAASVPCLDNHLFFSARTQGEYAETVGYANVKNTDSELNHTRTSTVQQSLTARYHNDILTVSLSGNYRQQHTSATVTTRSNLGTTRNATLRGAVQYTFCGSYNLSTDINHTIRQGYSSGFRRHTTLWNASFSKSFFENNNLSAFVRVYDLLRQRSSITRSITATAITDRESSVLGQYFLVGLYYNWGNNPPTRGKRSGGRQGGGAGGRGGGNRPR
jgi:hypothetical protein